MTVSPGLGTFEVEADHSLRRLRHAFVTLLDHAGLAATKPMDLARQLGIDKSLAWKVHRMIYPEKSMDVVRHLPGPAGIRRFVRAIQDQANEASDLGLIEKAIQDLEHIIEVHCGDRATFQMMMNSVADEPSEQIAEQHRQDLVRGASYVWGAHAKVLVRADYVAPSAEEGMLDIASVRGLVDLVRFRPNVPWILSHMRSTDNDMKQRVSVRRQAIDPTQKCDEAAPLLTEYCSKPLPETRRVPGATGFLHDELVESNVGAKGLVTCIMGERADAFASYYRDEHNNMGRHRFLVRTPADLMVFDLFVHRDLSTAMQPQFVLYSNLDLESGPAMTAAALERHRLPTMESIESLGAYPPRPATPEIPRYDEMVGYVFRQLGWREADFAGFRLKMRYPPLPTTAVFQWPLAPRSA